MQTLANLLLISIVAFTIQKCRAKYLLLKIRHREDRSVPTPRECCEAANVPNFCHGLCSPSDVMARQEERLTACSKYDAIIEKCLKMQEKCIKRCCVAHSVPMKCVEEKSKNQMKSRHNSTHLVVTLVMSNECQDYEETLTLCKLECTDDTNEAEWSEWSVCSKECGGGERTRTMKRSNKFSSRRTAFPHSEIQKEACNTQACEDVDECLQADNNCHTNAHCKNTIGGYTCTCNQGYIGDGFNCEDKDECVNADNNCHASANCSNTMGGFTCTCNQGYVGDGINCADIDECLNKDDNCHPSATCSNTMGSFTCACNQGYVGDGINCDDIDECLNRDHNCHPLATCTNSIGSFRCTCNQGYIGDGINCEDVKECGDAIHNCHANAVCKNTKGSFTCTCIQGYIGDGVNCQDIDECLNADNNCHENAACTNTIGGFICTCNNGYIGDGFNCKDVDECLEAVDNCHASAICKNTDGSFLCTCNQGYIGDGVDCEDIDECLDASNNCHATATCKNTIGSFTCTCNDGYIGDGVNCKDIDECLDAVDNCHANAVCINTKGSFTCACNQGHYGNGVNCEARTPRECCEDFNVSKSCLGLCSPAGVMARNENRLNACTQYDAIIEKCLQEAAGPEVSTKSSNVPETRTERTTEPNVQSKTTRNSQIQTDGVTENVSANPNGTASGCCAKIKVDSNGIARQHFWALGTFQRSNSLEKFSSGSKIIYIQDKSPHNRDQYYLEGNEEDGWRIGRNINGKIEGLLMYNGVKISCPANQWKSDWLVGTSSGYVPDPKLVIKCIGANNVCRYERLWTTDGIMDKTVKGNVLDIIYTMKSYSECESKCSLAKRCMNFEFCPKWKTCRLYDGKIASATSLKQKKWYDCYASYRTCKNVLESPILVKPWQPIPIPGSNGLTMTNPFAPQVPSGPGSLNSIGPFGPVRVRPIPPMPLQRPGEVKPIKPLGQEGIAPLSPHVPVPGERRPIQPLGPGGIPPRSPQGQGGIKPIKPLGPVGKWVWVPGRALVNDHKHSNEKQYLR